MNKLGLLNLSVVAALLFSTSSAFAHSSSDLSSEIAKYEESLKALNSEFKSLTNYEEKQSNIQSQLATIERKIFNLRDVLARDYSHVKSNMSKYEIDYMENIDKTLDEIDALLEQSSQRTR